MARSVQSDPFDQSDRLRDGLLRLSARAGHYQQQLEMAVAAGEAAITDGRIALAEPTEPSGACVDRLRSALRGQLQWHANALKVARELSVAARAQHVAVDRLVCEVDRDEGGPPRPPAPLGTHAVLVVDDYEDNRTLVAMCLQHAGFVVRTAANGLEAVIAAYEMRPSVIVMDVTMPILDGLEATRLIKAMDDIRDTPVIAYTAHKVAETGPDRRLFAAILQKPVSPDVVLATVQECANL